MTDLRQPYKVPRRVFLDAQRKALIWALKDCIRAAHDDKVEDFSAVSNAADKAAKLLRELGESHD